MKHNKEEIWQVRLNMFELEGWIKIKTKKKDLACSECKRGYKSLGEKISLMTLHNKPNVHLCSSCGQKYIDVGAVDISKKIEESKIRKNKLIEEIAAMKVIRDIEDRTVEELEEILPKIKEDYNRECDKQQKIKESQPTEEEWEIEKWLIDQYDVVQDKRYLTSEFEIEEYFKDSGYDYLDCGQGYYEDETTVLVKIGSKFFSVNITGEVGSAKQDRGDRLYWIDNIEAVTYKQVDKPIKKDKVSVDITLTLSNKDKDLLKKYLKRKKIEFKIN